MDWQDYVSAEERKDFLEREEKYVEYQHALFQASAGGKLENSMRALVLSKRLEFLHVYLLLK